MSVINRLAKAAIRFDSWLNLATGLGDPTMDKLRQATPQYAPLLDELTLEALWRSSDFAQRIVASAPERALKQGFGLTPASGDVDPDQAQQEAEELLKAADGFRLVEKFREAWCWGRLYGLGAVILGIEGSGAPDEPLDDEKASKLLYLTPVDARELIPLAFYDDALSDKYGEVETYQLRPVAGGASTQDLQGAIIHETRLVLFGGALTSRRERKQNQGRDYSVLQRVFDVLRQAESNWDSVCYLMTDISQAVYKLEGLLDIIATGNEAAMQARLQTIQMGRSVARAAVLDANKEDFERKATPLAGIPEILEQTWKRLASAAEMPLTVLMGVSPAGLNATGESDLRLWYDSIQTMRERMLGPRLERVVRLISKTLGHADPEAWKITWPSLWQMTASEQADYYLKTAQADHIYVADGVTLPEEVALSRFGKPEFDGAHTKIDVDARNKALEAAIQDLLNPPPPPIPGALPPGAGPPPQGGQRALPAAATDQGKLKPEVA